MTDSFGREAELDVPDVQFARITHASDSPPAVYLDYLDGSKGHATSDRDIPFEEGTVVFVSGCAGWMYVTTFDTTTNPV